MNPNRLLIFKNQGSDRLLEYFDTLAEKLAVDSQVTISGSCFTGLLRVVMSELKYYEIGGYFKDLIKFYRTSKLQLQSDLKTSSLIEEGVKATMIFSKLGLVSESLSVRLYYIIWIINAFNVKKILAGHGECLIIAPDEMYGFSAIVKFNSSPLNTWIINTNSTDLFCNVLNFDSPFHYKYFCRDNVPVSDVPVDDSLKLKIDTLYRSVFSNDIVHRDYTLAYSREKTRFFPKRQTVKKNVLVAAHIFKDAPNSHQFSFGDFELWLYEVLSSLMYHQNYCHVYVKEHPSVPLYREEGVLAGVLASFDMEPYFKFIPSNCTSSINDFDLIITCSGSICYEAAYQEIPVISCSRSFASNLSNVVEASNSDTLRIVLEIFFDNHVDDLFDLNLSDQQYRLLAQHAFMRNICNIKLDYKDAHMYGTSEDEIVNISEIADSFLRALQGFYSQRNKPGMTLLSPDLSKVEVLHCLR